MRILLIWDEFPPEVGGGADRVAAFCKYLTRWGHELRVVAKRQGGLMYTDSGDVHVPAGCRVSRTLGMSLPTLFPGSGYVPGFLRASLRFLKEEPIDIIHASGPLIGCNVVGAALKRLLGKPFLAGIRDPWVRLLPRETFHQHETHGGYSDPRTPVGAFRLNVERFAYGSADAIEVTNPSIKEETCRLHSIPRERVEVIFNAVDLEEFEGIAPQSFDRFTVLHAGVIFKGRGILALVQAVEQTPDIRLLFTGGGGDPRDRDEMLRYVKERGLGDRVRYLGVLPRKKFLAHLAGADAFFAGFDAWEQTRYLLPSKVFHYMATGKPVVAAGLPGGDLDSIVRTTECGLMLPPADPRAIATALQQLRDDPALARRLGRNGRQAVEREYNRERQVRKLESIYRKIADTS